jgi:hypothetical protein
MILDLLIRALRNMESIPLNNIYQHKLNFLIGAGASSGLFPTLWLSVKDSNDKSKEETIETLATKLDLQGYKHHHTLLFMYYYQEIIEPVCKFILSNVYTPHIPPCSGDENCLGCQKQKQQQEVICNYETFIDSIVRLLQHKNVFSRRCNLFTTNYDGCVPFVADKLLKKGNLAFNINDGSSGFLERTLAAKNFNTFICESGVFGKHSTDIPQINFINIHGSAYWRRNGETISVDYASTATNVVIPPEAKDYLNQLADILKDSTKTTEDVLAIDVKFSDDTSKVFWGAYDKLPIVNPTKWKFHETVFEEHYYQMLRLMSYQLEEPNSVFISFAFSFADEHILNLVKRSLSNPKLQMYVCCFDEKEKLAMGSRFNKYPNVKLITLNGENLDFTKFNSTVFSAALLSGAE